MKFICFIALFLLPNASSALEATPQDLLQSIEQIVEGIIASAPGPLRPNYVFKVIKNIITGVPAQIANGLANSICSAVIAKSKDQTPDKYEPNLQDINFQFRTACDRREYSIEDPSSLADDSDFDPTKKTVIFSTGWTTTVNNERHDAFSKAYNCRGDTNYLALDVGDYINTLYVWSAQNTDKIGQYLAEGIQHLESFINITDLHLIGHSLGAQIMGSAARYYYDSTGVALPYVTGIDPAFPCFNEGEELTTISLSDADFVDIIHTDPGVSGQYQAYGHADFYVGGKFPVQDACNNPQCSHEIVWKYYTESVYPNNERNFLSKRCKSLNSLQEGRCDGDEYPMGFAVPHYLRGRYVLEVNSDKPYGKNATVDYTDPDDSVCGSCEELKK
ncbi:vitellogenin-1-like [Ceratitis capitata]|uniref:vitellogenin-1-like n=1 Tax=Ceratitis capitata TaxID=7213 RepID=UPI00032A2DC7|nr:vitellogenin-1-like [Ceratitis capitata]